VRRMAVARTQAHPWQHEHPMIWGRKWCSAVWLGRLLMAVPALLEDDGS